MVALALFVAASGVGAQSWPAKPVRLVVGFGPGGVADITARVVAQRLAQDLGQPFIVDNRPGAGGIVAADAVAKAPPDGYTLLLMSNANAVGASLFKVLPYDVVADFAPVSTLGYFDLAVVTTPEAGIDSLRNLVARAKASPGRLAIGTINIGSTQHLAAELFKSMAGIDATTVPYKGSPAVVAALRGHEVDIAFEMLAPVVPQARSGAVRILAVTSERRSPLLPDVPTVAESGVAGYQATSWNAIAGPARLPAAIVDRINRAIGSALAAPEVKERLEAAGVTARGSTPRELRELVVADVAKWRRVIEAAKLERQ